MGFVQVVGKPEDLDRLYHGDSREVLPTLDAESVDSIVSDPPAGISFMSRAFDDPDQYDVEVADDAGDRDKFVEFLRIIMAEARRVLKPGAYGLIWSLPRTSHWTALAMEKAGFEIRDSILHVFGSGFPKSHNIGKAIQALKARLTGADPDTKELTDADAKKWEGWGTALKPAVEVWWLVRKPLREKNIAEQVLSTGTGGINIDAARVKHADAEDLAKHQEMVAGIKARGGVMANSWKNSSDLSGASDVKEGGRWPANLVLSHSPECKQIGTETVKAPVINKFTDGMKPFGEGAGHPYESSGGGTEEQAVYECAENCPVKKLNEQEAGNPARYFNQFEPDPPGTFQPQYDVPFFYTGKAAKRDKNADLFDPASVFEVEETGLINKHPTTKSQSLMKHLVKIVTPKGGTVLDPFAGSGSTLVAAADLGMHSIGIERETEYIEIATKRVKAALEKAKDAAAEQSGFDFLMSFTDE